METVTNYIVKKVPFEIILPIWKNYLWSSRTSEIKTHSSMTWPYPRNKEYNLEIYNYPATYWAIYKNNKVIGVNSGHKTSDYHYRSRGLWVDKEYRGVGLGKKLLDHTINQAKIEDCLMVWSIPRITALPTYKKSGFLPIGDIFKTETCDKNIYAINRIKEYI